VLGILGDKDAGAMIDALIPQTDVWYLTDLPGPRGGSAEALATQLRALHPDATIRLHGDPGQALAQALADGMPGDRVVVTGSFLTVALAAPAPL
jgi:dihydrofolate synthase/folylpolyglutamate synthase